MVEREQSKKALTSSQESRPLEDAPWSANNASESSASNFQALTGPVWQWEVELYKLAHYLATMNTHCK